MSVSALASVDYSRYFTLLRDGLPVPAVFLVRDVVGNVIAESSGAGAGQAEARCNACVSCPQSDLPADRTLLVGQDARNICYTLPLYSTADEFTGTLSAVISAELASTPGLSASQVEHLLASVVTVVEQELRLTVELDSMARELAGRYEELNLVYDNNENDSHKGLETETHNRLVEDYVEYLGVDLVEQLAHLPRHHLIELVERDAGAMVRDAALGEVVGADLLRPLTRA
ncbi:MAG: hypothetical protein R3308_06760, partial [Thiohalobacterales bacterium]|nr:hypothetical protein [Thiohalobacterales bacterium]